MDVFHVELGAALLLQFQGSEGEPVTVLADAGAHGGNFRKDHVLIELKKALNFGPQKRLKIDLLVGTHYDSDHLNQMVAIIDDEMIDIGEAWMPPVADDTEDPPAGRQLDDSSLLALKFARTFEEQSEYRSYLDRKRTEIEDSFALDNLIRSAAEEAHQSDLGQSKPAQLNLEKDAQGTDEKQDRGDSEPLDFFLDVLRATPGQLDSCVHAGVPDIEDERDLQEGLQYPYSWTGLRRTWMMETLRGSKSNKDFVREFATEIPDWNVALQRLAILRGTSAKQAVNAAALNDVVVALKRKKVPVWSRRIADGEPRRFCWDSNFRKFVEAAGGRNGGIDLTLLGPSDSLIRKHWHRLPKAIKYEAALFLQTIPIVSISPSNQLSYVLHFKAERQGILVSGDTGCNDFKPLSGQGGYYPQLISALSPLNVVQVAHHGGANAHFYRVLQAAAVTGELAAAYFLLSHERSSKSRPSHAFRLFMGNARGQNEGPTLLFTSAPNLSNVLGYEDLIHSVAGKQGETGNIVMTFDARGWRVVSHSIDSSKLSG